MTLRKAQLNCLVVATVGQGYPVLGAVAWDAAKQGRHVTALAGSPATTMWVGTEDSGVWRYRASAPEGKGWTQYTTRDGLGDDNGYAVAVDVGGRVWVGHRSHGVSVFDGQRWRNYDQVTGSLGERVHGLAVSPVGNVWMATNRGLSCWCPEHDRWRHYTMVDGLPSNQIAAVAVDSRGRVIAGTACDGLAWASSDGDYRQWHVVPGSRQVVRAAGGSRSEVLPSNQIAAVLVAKDQRVFVGTTAGLAVSATDDLRYWDFVRGRNWADKVKGQRVGPPKDWQAKGDGPLAEDYVTALAQDAAGRVWVGYRQAGLQALEKQGSAIGYTFTPAKGVEIDPVRAILPVAGAKPLVAWYGAGWSVPNDAPATPMPRVPAAQTPPSAELPAPALPPAATELAALRERLAAQTEPLAVGGGYHLGEDWQTAGDWMGRYGRYDATLCAVQAPMDHVIGLGQAYHASGRIGPHHKAGDSLRYWVHWLRTEDKRTLWDPVLGYRRQADWDDHGEDYAMTWEGPDVWAEVTVPAGLHRLSLYFVNKDGHDGPNRWRDYRVELKPFASGEVAADLAPTLAEARVNDFWGGCHTQFVVRGPASFGVRVGRNHSFNTILQAVFLDKLQGPPLPHDRLPAAFLGNLRYGPPDAGGQVANAQQGEWARLWAELDTAWGRAGVAGWQQPCRLLCYRAAVAAGEPDALLANWRWRMPLWTTAERSDHDQMMDRAYRAMVAMNPQLATLQR